jgi:hypothetical protein
VGSSIWSKKRHRVRSCFNGIVSHLNRFIRYLLRIPAKWDATTSPRPIVFLHGLGFGLVQYHVFLSQLLETFTDRPILVPLQPQVSQNIFHPLFLKPLDRHQMADRLAGLVEELGWATLLSNGKNTKEMDFKEKVVESSQIKDTCKGITILSHSKYTSFIHHGLYFISKINLPQRFLYAHLDVKRTSQYRCSFLLCRSSYFLFMGGGSVSIPCLPCYCL